MSIRNSRRGDSTPNLLPATASSIAARCSGAAFLIAGAMGTGVTHLAHRRSRRAASGRSVEHRDRHRHPGLRHAVEVRDEEGRAHADQSQERAAHQPGAHAAPSAQRHDHAERPAFRSVAHRLSRHRPGQAPAGDPRPGEAAAGLHARALARYPMVSRINFVECGGNSAPLYNKDPVQANVQAIHGLVSCSEWTGVRLSTLLEETGIDPKAKWLLAEGADGPSMNRSIPIAKALDDAMIALYQNGERIAPSNGYPMRLLVPGYEGNMNVKWLHRIKLVEEPVMAINETMQYTYRVAGPKIWQFFFPMEVKSFVTHPSPGLTLKGPGFYEISGLAYSGNGRIAKVMVSADGGKSWGEAALDAPVLSKALTRFRMPWRWDGQPVVLQSRAWDEAGNVQPTRERAVRRARRAQGQRPRHRVPDGAHEHHHELGHRHQRGGQACLCVSSLAVVVPLALRIGRGRSRCRQTGRGSANPSPRPISRCGTSASDRTAPDCRPAAARPPRAPSSTRRSASSATARKARTAPMPRSAGPQRTIANYVPACDDDLRLHAAGDAVAAAEVAHQ